MAKIKYEVYEDNAGGLYLYILNSRGEPTEVYEGWEYAQEPGIMVDVLADLAAGIMPDSVRKVSCDVDWAYRESCSDHELIAYNGWVQRGSLMEAAGRRAFGYPEW